MAHSQAKFGISNFQTEPVPEGDTVLSRNTESIAHLSGIALSGSEVL
jgi:hypothetical protein